MVPTILQDSKITCAPQIDIEEYCAGVVHPVTKETITKYHKLIEEPLLREFFFKGNV